MQALLPLAGLLHTVARAGGGGSVGGGGFSGGGYHGGNSGGSNAGGDVIVAVLAGMLPVEFVVRYGLRRFSYRTSLITGAAIAIISAVLVLITAGFMGIATVFGAGFGLLAGSTGLTAKLQRKLFRSDRAMQLAAGQDSAWQEDVVQERVQKMFYDYQQDWSDFNVAHMQTYMTERYYRHADLMLAALQQMGRRNIVSAAELLGIDAIEVVDSPNNAEDRFSVLIAARTNDRLVDTASGKALYDSSVVFREIWWFDRSGDTWDLAQIDQATADDDMVDVALERFAQKHDMFYSLDWGRLLLPQRGQLFGSASFSRSDINNHVIGRWGDLIVQLYTYMPYAQAAENYLVAQIALPKSYGGIIIRRNGGWRQWFEGVPRGYRRVSMEWPDFNKRYTVYATNADQVTSFELLNPKFMADLYDRRLPFNIEVVDNVVYLYASTTRMLVSGSYQRYAGALDVLQAAYKELYM